MLSWPWQGPSGKEATLSLLLLGRKRIKIRQNSPVLWQGWLKKSKSCTWKQIKAKLLILYINRWNLVIYREVESQNAQKLCHKTKNKFHPSLPSLSIMAQQMPYGMEHPFGQFGSDVLVCSLPNSCSSLTHRPWGSWRVGAEKKALMLWEHCLAGPQTLLCYQHYSGHKFRAALC